MTDGDVASPILVSLSEGVLTLTLNRPDKLNSFNQAMHLALRAGFQRAANEPEVRAVLLTGAGRGFSAGQDLGDPEALRALADQLGGLAALLGLRVALDLVHDRRSGGEHTTGLSEHLGRGPEFDRARVLEDVRLGHHDVVEGDEQGHVASSWSARCR